MRAVSAATLLALAASCGGSPANAPDASAPAEVAADLQKRGEVVDTSKPNFSGVQAISLGTKDGVRFLSAGADPRKGGSALVE